MGSKPEDNLSASQAILDYMSEAAAGHVEAKHNRFGAFFHEWFKKRRYEKCIK